MGGSRREQRMGGRRRLSGSSRLAEGRDRRNLKKTRGGSERGRAHYSPSSDYFGEEY